MPLDVLGIVGLPGSGKTEAAKALSELDVAYVRMGDVVWQEVERRGLRLTDDNIAKISEEFREKEGMGAIAKRCVPLIKAAGKGKKAVVVDGIRGISEVNEFRKAFGKGFHLIAVIADEKIRYRRVASRRREGDPLTPEKFRERDMRELGWGLGEALAMADITFKNEGPVEELRRLAVDYFKREIGGKS
jgi:dephospho-CoA kinase